MATLVTTVPRVPKFNAGDKVEFSIISRHDNYSPEYKTMYGFAFKVNSITMHIMGVDGNRYAANISEVKKYIDPFA